METSFNANDVCSKARWTVDARRLRGNDKQVVSPSFEMCFGDGLPKAVFKLMLYPIVVSSCKGGASFKMARSWGYVQLKCESELPRADADLSVAISVGDGARSQPWRGPVVHNFSSNAVCGPSRPEDQWDFGAAVDEASMTFAVRVEVAPLRRPA